MPLIPKVLNHINLTNFELIFNYIRDTLTSVASQLIRVKHNRFLKHLIHHYFAVFIENGFNTELSNDDGTEILQRRLIYDVFSLLNHSCVPIVSNILKGNIMVHTAARWIQMNSQLTISYIRLFNTNEGG